MISTHPKCGTTWMQMLCALLVFDTPDLPRPLTEISPWLDTTTHDLDATLAQLDAQRHRRFIKTHTPLDGLPASPDVTYIGVARDPRDVMLSFEHATANIHPDAMGRLDTTDLPAPPEDPLERFWLWADADFANSPTSFCVTLPNLVHHVRTFWDRRDEPQVALFHYSDLLADLPTQLQHLAAALRIDLDAEHARELAEAATFDTMRRRADDLAPGVDAHLWTSNQGFFRAGSSGQWRELLDAPALERYQRRVAAITPPDLAEWLHRS
ncbi:MAG TPA: sulfotransferase domain-containing protein [Actinophytocola sp.]|nr:sulfotransferase domain-containing protein [Actinophytocola sp.]